MADPQLATREGKVALRNKQGEIGLVDPARASEYLQEGFTPVSNEEMTQAERKAQLETPQAQIGTALRATAEAAGAPINWAAMKLGAPNLFEAGLTPEQIAENKAMAEANPLSRMGGEIVGQVAGLKGLGIAGAAAKAGAAVKGAGLAATLGRGAVTAGIEGAGLGAMGAMEDPEASAGHVLASGAMMAALGGGLGTAFAGAGRGLSRVFGRAATDVGQDLAERASLETALKDAAAAPANSGRAAQTYNEIASKLTGVDKGLLEEVGPFGTRSAEAEETAHNLPRIIDRTALEMRPELNEAQKAVKDVTRIFQQRDLTAEQIRKIGGSGFDTEARRNVASMMVNDAADALEANLEMAPTELLGGSVRKKVEVLQREFTNLAKQAAESGDAAESLTLARQAKRAIARTVDDWGDDLQRMTQSGRITSSEARELQNAQQMLIDTHEKLRQGLRDPGLWGKSVASAQSEIDDVFHEGGVSALRRFEKTFMVDTGDKVWGQGIRVTESDPGKIANVLRQLGTPDRFIAEGALNDYTTMAKKLVETIGQKYGLEGAEGEAVQRAIKSLESVSNRMSAVKDSIELAGKWETMAKKSGESGGLLGNAPVIGTLLGGPVGLAAGVLAKAVTNPAAMAGMRNATADAAQKLGIKISGYGKWISGGAKVGPPLERTAAGGRAIGLASALTVFRGKHKTDSDAYEERTKTVLAADVGRLGPHIEGLPPAVQYAAGTQAAVAIDFLKSQIPAWSQSPSLMQPTRKAPPPVADQLKFGKAWATVVDPMSAIVDLRNGRMTPIQALTLKTVYPRIYQDIQQTTVQAIAQADAVGNRIPIHVRQQLDALLDLNGAGEPAFGEQMTNRIQAALAAQQQKQQQKTQAPKLAQNLAAPSAAFGAQQS